MQRTNESCRNQWTDWNAFCELEWTDECTDVKVAIAEEFRVDAPTVECFNEAAFKSISDNAVCNTAWTDWKLFCNLDRTDECGEVDTAFRL